MRLSLADVILDCQAIPHPHRRGREPGMAEGELARAIEALHERSHAVAVVARECVDARSVDLLDRGCRGYTI
jgi:hypothetical protein